LKQFSNLINGGRLSEGMLLDIAANAFDHIFPLVILFQYHPVVLPEQ
jgi:hypothetical protein